MPAQKHGFPQNQPAQRDSRPLVRIFMQERLHAGVNACSIRPLLRFQESSYTALLYGPLAYACQTDVEMQGKQLATQFDDPDPPPIAQLASVTK